MGAPRRRVDREKGELRTYVKGDGDPQHRLSLSAVAQRRSRGNAHTFIHGTIDDVLFFDAIPTTEDLTTLNPYIAINLVIDKRDCFVIDGARDAMPTRSAASCDGVIVTTSHASMEDAKDAASMEYELTDAGWIVATGGRGHPGARRPRARLRAAAYVIERTLMFGDLARDADTTFREILPETGHSFSTRL